jgi:stringent starvation protein B
MTPSRPYLLRALNQWIIDNSMTPHIVINANYNGVVVPREHVENGQIILCIAPQAVHGLEMANSYMSFAAKFSGVSREIYLPIMSITAIYAEENRKGMVFADEIYETSETEDTSSEHKQPPSKITAATKKDKLNKDKSRPRLTIVASNPDPEDKKNK